MRGFMRGVDGIRGGWLIAWRHDGDVQISSAENFADVLTATSDCAVVAVDMPIGLLTTTEIGGRTCERVTRRLLGSRHSCVFSSPSRAALAAESFSAAQEANKRNSSAGIGITKQTWSIFGKLREIDSIMTRALQARVVEVHPEWSFSTLRDLVASGDRTMQTLAKKKSSIGRQQRSELLRRVEMCRIDELIRVGKRLGGMADDVLDACIAAWTASRVADGTARRVPDTPQIDAHGLHMEIRA
jgi:predicted RNase H-like nuclease